MSGDDRPWILVVDDSPANLIAVEAVLQPLDVEVVTAGSGEEALWHLLRHDFAVVILDVAMPGMDGFETATRIRERDRNRAMPIVFLTAHRIPASAARVLALGAAEYLEKPIDPDLLRAKVAGYLSGRLASSLP